MNLRGNLHLVHLIIDGFDLWKLTRFLHNWKASWSGSNPVLSCKERHVTTLSYIITGKHGQQFTVVCYKMSGSLYLQNMCFDQGWLEQTAAQQWSHP